MTTKIIPVTDMGWIVGEVVENYNLESPEDNVSGSRHSGIARLPDGRFVYLRSSSQKDEESQAYVITPGMALTAVLMSENCEELLREFPELGKLRKAQENSRNYLHKKRDKKLFLPSTVDHRSVPIV